MSGFGVVAPLTNVSAHISLTWDSPARLYRPSKDQKRYAIATAMGGVAPPSTELADRVDSPGADAF